MKVPQFQKSSETAHEAGIYLWVEVRLYFLQRLIHFGKTSGGRLTVDSPIWTNATDGHIHISAVHLRRAIKTIVLCYKTTCIPTCIHAQSLRYL